MPGIRRVASASLLAVVLLAVPMCSSATTYDVEEYVVLAPVGNGELVIADHPFGGIGCEGVDPAQAIFHRNESGEFTLTHDAELVASRTSTPRRMEPSLGPNGAAIRLARSLRSSMTRSWSKCSRSMCRERSCP